MVFCYSKQSKTDEQNNTMIRLLLRIHIHWNSQSYGQSKLEFMSYHQKVIILPMYYLKQLLGKGRYGIYLTFAVITQTQRNYMLPKTKVYNNIRKKAEQQLKYTDPDRDTQNLDIQKMSEEDKRKLKTITKKQIDQIQHVQKQKGSTTAITCSILGLGVINYFIAPTACGFFISTYLTLLSVDFLKSMFVIKYGTSTPWSWKMQDVGYLMTFAAGVFSVAVLTKTGLSKLRERAQRGLVVKDMPQQNK